MEETIVRIRGLTKSFGDLAVLKGIDLDIARGEKIAIIGASGSGKSTILRILMTLTEPDGGRVEIDGESLWSMERNGAEVRADEAHLRRMRQKVGMVFQQFNLFPHLTVLRNVALAPQVTQGIEREKAEARARSLLDRVGLADKADAWPAQLSGGQKQRVAIARALAPEPSIMLFDEITSALDPELVVEVLRVLRRLADEGEVTMLVVTHQMHFAEDFADRVLFVDEGRILESGPPSGIFRNPVEERTREFLKVILETT
jgi:polar amino acid transport system ATP-binding protein